MADCVTAEERCQKRNEIIMIHVFIGTKAQYVKMAPVIIELDKRGVPINLIDSGQHSNLSKKYRQFFKIREPDTLLRRDKADITGVVEMVLWLIALVIRIVFMPGLIKRTWFKNQRGVCLVHGDTPTTAISTLAARRCGISVVHVESGLRSFNNFHPFPEEIIRQMVMRWANILISNSEWTRQNLLRMNYEEKIVNVEGNTNIDSLRLINEQSADYDFQIDFKKSYAVFSIHRVETILSKRRLKVIADLVVSVSKDHNVLFCVHPPTRKRLLKTGLLKLLETTSGATLVPLLPYPEFIGALRKSDFVVSDGGSIQEECYYLGIPCLVMRYHTERLEGIGENIVLSKFDPSIINNFLESYLTLRVTEQDLYAHSPSEKIVDFITELKMDEC